MDTQTKESTLHLVVIAALIVMVGIVSFFKWPSDVTGAAPIEPHCIVPDDGRHYLDNTKFCAGEYPLPQGITLGKSGISLNCNHAILVGDGKKGAGITLEQDNQVVKNCAIKDYNFALHIKGNNAGIDDSNTFVENNMYYKRDAGKS